jgi:hypothetical protein
MFYCVQYHLHKQFLSHRSWNAPRVMQAYGERGIREIPPNATLTMDVQLLSIKQNTFGFRTKIVEG